MFILFFFFKQKTAYEMRISDWSSDVCSSDLLRLPGPVLKTRFAYYVVHPAHRRPRAPAAAFIEWLREEARDTAPASETASPPVGAAHRSRPAAPAGAVSISRHPPARSSAPAGRRPPGSAP